MTRVIIGFSRSVIETGALLTGNSTDRSYSICIGCRCRPAIWRWQLDNSVERRRLKRRNVVVRTENNCSCMQ